MQNKDKQVHPLLPNGAWDGFYTYTQGPGDEHPMPSHFTFSNSQIQGAGSDDVGGFSWRGTYDLTNMTCQLTKCYSTHSVDYSGFIDEQGIWGQWKLFRMTGWFHLWPAKSGKEEEEEVEATSKMLLKVK